MKLLRSSLPAKLLYVNCLHGTTDDPWTYGLDMWMCETCIVIEKRNADGNSLAELVAALKHAGATIEEIDEERHVIYALVAASDLATIRLMEGVAYVRVVYHYHAEQRIGFDGQPAVAAAG